MGEVSSYNLLFVLLKTNSNALAEVISSKEAFELTINLIRFS